MKISKVKLKSVFDEAVDPQSSNIYNLLLISMVNNLGSVSGDDYISMKDLVDVLSKLSKEWDKEIDKVLGLK